MQMLGQQPFRHWHPFIESLELEETIAADPALDIARWAELGDEEKQEARAALVAVIDEAFSRRTLAEWRTIFDAADVWYQVVQVRLSQPFIPPACLIKSGGVRAAQTFEEVLEDPQAAAAGAWAEVEGLDYPLVAAPLSFHADAASPEDAAKLRGAPGLGEHNVAVMEELGLSAEQIDGLQRAGVLSTESNSPRRL